MLSKEQVKIEFDKTLIQLKECYNKSTLGNLNELVIIVAKLSGQLLAYGKVLNINVEDIKAMIDEL